MSLLKLESFEVVACSERKGVGLFTTRAFKQGEALYPFDYWSEEMMPMHATNHSCDPNATFNDEGMLVALRDIEEGEEVTFNYLLHPIPASPWNFKCECGAASCLGWINASTQAR